MESNLKKNKKIHKQKRIGPPTPYKKPTKFQSFVGSIISFVVYGAFALIGFYLNQKFIRETIYVKYIHQNVPTVATTRESFFTEKIDLSTIEMENGDTLICYGLQNRGIVLSSKTYSFANFLHENKEFVSFLIKILQNYQFSEILETVFYQNEIILTPIYKIQHINQKPIKGQLFATITSATQTHSDVKPLVGLKIRKRGIQFSHSMPAPRNFGFGASRGNTYLVPIESRDTQTLAHRNENASKIYSDVRNERVSNYFYAEGVYGMGVEAPYGLWGTIIGKGGGIEHFSSIFERQNTQIRQLNSGNYRELKDELIIFHRESTRLLGRKPDVIPMFIETVPPGTTTNQILALEHAHIESLVLSGVDAKGIPPHAKIEFESGGKPVHAVLILNNDLFNPEVKKHAAVLTEKMILSAFDVSPEELRANGQEIMNRLRNPNGYSLSNAPSTQTFGVANIPPFE
jgi:hypothetical protein